MSSIIQSSSDKEQLPLSGVFHLVVTYLVWGSTYLAIRVAVREGSGFPPFMLGATRVLLAGPILIGFAWILKQRIRPTRKELITLVISGTMLWLGGNGLVNWAEQRVHSGVTALIVGSMPLWVAFMDAAIDRKAPSMRLVGSLLLGFSGLAVLMAPVFREGVRADIISVLALIAATISWGAGSLFQQRRGITLHPAASSGYQQFFGGIGFLTVALIIREPLPTPTAEAWAAWGYLVVFGSLLAFTSFIYSLKLLPASIAMTYAYVNPVIAVILGWLILDEPITIWTIGGAGLVLAGVFGVFRERYGKRRNKH